MSDRFTAKELGRSCQLSDAGSALNAAQSVETFHEQPRCAAF